MFSVFKSIKKTIKSHNFKTGQKASPLGWNAFPFGEGVGIADGRGHSLPFRGRCRLCRRKRTIRQKVSPLGGVYISFGLNWEECRRRETLLSIEIQYGKEGLPQIWNKSGLNNKSRYISWLSNTLSLIYNLLAPLFRRMRATFPQFNFLCLCFSPQSGKTFCFPVHLFYDRKCSHLADFM